MSLSNPLFVLTWYGALLPCLEKEEDRKARQALSQVNAVGQHVQWYPQGSAGNPPSSSLKSAVSSAMGFFRRSLSGGGGLDDDAENNNNNDAASQGSSSSNQSLGATNTTPSQVPAKLSVRDNPDTGVPEIFINPIESSSSSSNNNNSNNNKRKAKKKKKRGSSILDSLKTSNSNDEQQQQASSSGIGYKLNIALHRVGTVDVNPETGLLKIMAKPPSDSEQSVQTLATLELLSSSTSTTQVPADVRDTFVHHLLVLLEWERQRRLAHSIEESLSEQDARNGNFLTQRAQTAARFAKRELELQQTKRQRESRKHQLMQESGGGMKYTALAMMQRQDNAA